MQKDTDTAGLPLELIMGIDGHRNGLRHAELRQMRGPKSYVPVPGERYQFFQDGEPTPPDEPTSTSTADIARTFLDAAQRYRAEHQGDARFSVRCYYVDKDGEIHEHDVKFSVDDAVDAAPTESKPSMEQKFHDIVLKYVDGLQSHNLLLVKNIGTAVAWPAEVMPNLLSLHLSSLENLMLGQVIGGGNAKQSEQWKEAASSLKDLIKGPIGQAVAKKLGVDVESTDLRQLLATFGDSLTIEQRAAMVQQFGTKAAGFKEAAKATTESEALQILGKTLDSLAEEDWNYFEQKLDDKQKAIVEKLFERVKELTEQPKS